MGFGEAVRSCFDKFLTFSGRARRAEYWWFVLFNILGSIIAGMIDRALFGSIVVVTVGRWAPSDSTRSSDGVPLPKEPPCGTRT